MKNKLGTKELENKIGKMTFAKAIEAQRLAEDMTLKEFASFLGISIASLADLEKGRRIPSPSRAFEIAKKIGEPEVYWIQLAIQDKLIHDELYYKVTVA
jgi:transcriptional regulator with XRE-family HTH domain